MKPDIPTRFVIFHTVAPACYFGRRAFHLAPYIRTRIEARGARWEGVVGGGVARGWYLLMHTTWTQLRGDMGSPAVFINTANGFDNWRAIPFLAMPSSLSCRPVYRCVIVVMVL